MEATSLTTYTLPPENVPKEAAPTSQKDETSSSYKEIKTSSMDARSPAARIAAIALMIFGTTVLVSAIVSFIPMAIAFGPVGVGIAAGAAALGVSCLVAANYLEPKLFS